MKTFKTIQNIKKYLLNNEEVLRHIVEDINCYDASLDFLGYWDNDEETLNAMFENSAEALRAACYGQYNYWDPYFRFNAYGNLESFDDYELMEELKYYIDEVVNSLLRCWECLDITNKTLLKLLEEEK